MTRDEAFGYLMTHAPLIVARVIAISYDDNCEIVDRTITEEEARHLDEEIGRNMQFDKVNRIIFIDDNPLSEEDK